MGSFSVSDPLFRAAWGTVFPDAPLSGAETIADVQARLATVDATKLEPARLSVYAALLGQLAKAQLPSGGPSLDKVAAGGLAGPSPSAVHAKVDSHDKGKGYMVRRELSGDGGMYDTGGYAYYRVDQPKDGELVYHGPFTRHEVEVGDGKHHSSTEIRYQPAVPESELRVERYARSQATGYFVKRTVSGDGGQYDNGGSAFFLVEQPKPGEVVYEGPFTRHQVEHDMGPMGSTIEVYYRPDVPEAQLKKKIFGAEEF